MVGQELHLTEHETLRITGETPDQLEVEASWGPGGGNRLPRTCIRIRMRSSSCSPGA
jgi:hypothetical protein